MVEINESNILQYPIRSQYIRCGIILTNHKHSRFVIARVDTINYPIVFLREWEDDIEYGYEEYYSLYESALTPEEADEILLLLKSEEKRKANALLKRFFKPEGALCEFVGAVRLDDAVPDKWYDVWEEIEGLITFRRDHSGYYEMEVGKQVDVSVLSDSEMDEELEKGYSDMKVGKTKSVQSTFADIRKDYDI